MPQRPIPQFWKDRVIAHLSRAEQRGERASDAVIEHELIGEAGRMKESGDQDERELSRLVPSRRSIQRIRLDEYPGVGKEKKRDYRVTRWPQALVQGDLPWESGPVVLELLRELDSITKIGWLPSINVSKWFWRVSQSAPDLPVSDRLKITSMLLASDSMWDAVQYFLAYHPWRSNKDEEAYKAATSRKEHSIPILPQGAWYSDKKNIGPDELEFLTVVNLMSRLEEEADNGDTPE